MEESLVPEDGCDGWRAAICLLAERLAPAASTSGPSEHDLTSLLLFILGRPPRCLF